MGLLNDVVRDLPDGNVLEVRIGLHWTVVVVSVNGNRQCGLASTLKEEHPHTGEPDIPEAGFLQDISGKELAKFALQERFPQTSIGVAAINALLPKQPETWQDQNAEKVILEHGRGKNVAIIGHFPFIPAVRESAGKLSVVELKPVDGEVAYENADQVLPDADVVAITGMTLVNHTFDDLIKLCSKKAFILMLGPSTPISPVLFDYGIHVISGSFISKIEPVLRTAGQGGTFRQIHKAGVRLVTILQN